MDDEAQPPAPSDVSTRRGSGTIHVRRRAIRVRYQVATSLAGRAVGSAIILSGGLFWSHEPLELESDDGGRMVIRLTHVSGRLLRFVGVDTG